MNPTITVTETGDEFFLKDAVGTLQNAKAYIGIPDDETIRRKEIAAAVNSFNKVSGVTNAGLLYIHTNGSELKHIPARPVIEPTIEANRLWIEAGLFEVAQLILDKHKVAARHKLKEVGTLVANRAKGWFTNPQNGWKQNAPSTIRRKLAKLKGKTIKTNKKYLNAMTVEQLVGQHMPTYGTTLLDTINTPLIDTGELRRSITHVEELD